MSVNRTAEIFSKTGSTGRALLLAILVSTQLFIQPPAADGAEIPAGMMNDLYQKAKADKEIVWAASRLPSGAAAVFEARFPGIKLIVVNVPAPQLPPRILTEAQLKRLSIDVGTASISSADPLVERDLLVTLPMLPGLDPKNVTLNNRMVLANDLFGGWIYNTRNVSPAELPRKPEDFLAPRWRGKITIGQSATPFASWDGLPADKIQLLLEGLAKQEPVVATAVQSLDRVARGESDLTNGAGFNTAALAREQGAPIDVVPRSDVYLIPQGLFSVKGLPHPNAANLFIAWATGTQEGRATLAKLDFGRHTDCGPRSVEKWLCGKDLTIYAVDTLEKARLDINLEPMRLKALNLLVR